jgi:hypothetical protein
VPKRVVDAPPTDLDQQLTPIHDLVQHRFRVLGVEIQIGQDLLDGGDRRALVDGQPVRLLGRRILQYQGDSLQGEPFVGAVVDRDRRVPGQLPVAPQQMIDRHLVEFRP